MQKKHKMFTRKGADLVIEKKITLLEALTGTSFIIKHLDGRKIKIESDAGTVIKPDSLMTVTGLGMPFYKKSYEFGNLLIKFSVEFPDSIPVGDKITSIHEALASTKGQEVKATEKEVDEVCVMQKLEDGHKNTHAEGGKTHDHEDEDEDDEEHGHGPQVGCQQQ